MKLSALHIYYILYISSKFHSNLSTTNKIRKETIYQDISLKKINIVLCCNEIICVLNKYIQLQIS